jgi:plastocyanin
MRTRVVRSCLSRFAGILLCCLAATGLLATGCKSGSLGPAKQYAQVDYAHGGTVSGIVHFTKTAPSPIQIDMAQDPICAMAGDDMTDSIVVHKGGLANVLVYIESGLGNKTYPITREPVVIDQKGCRFVPHVSAAMAGQQVEFTNSDNTIHNVHMSPTAPGNNAFDITQRAHADPVSRYFHSPEVMIPMRCNNHPWMHGYLNILANPFFALTDKDGTFSIRGLPPGTYTLTAVQEQLGKKSATITVGADGKITQSFAF